MKSLAFAARALALLSLCTGAAAQRPPAQLDGAAILHRMNELGVLGSVLYVAAHPDDENTRLISYLSNGKQVRTAYLSITRGDGGQNLIGPELGEALGILRTQELLEARRIDGGEQFFTRAVDFGYSKSPEETFEKWGRKEVLGDVVRVVRQFRPDVILTRFATDGSGGHGHHTASALLAHEAFDLAADPSAYPEQIAEGLKPWQAKRLFFNASTWWNSKLPEMVEKDPTGWVRLDVGGFDPLLGTSYTELAGRSRSQHKSQGFGAAETRGEQIEYLRLDKGEKLSKPDLFDGIDLGWERVAGGARILAMLREITLGYDVRAPERSVSKLAELVRAIESLGGSNGGGSEWVRLQANAARELCLQACGVVIEANAKSPAVAAGQSVEVELSAMQRRAGPPLLELVGYTAPDGEEIAVEKPLAFNRASTTLHRFDAAEGATYRAKLRLPDGLEIAVERAAMHEWVDRVDGERTRPLAITPVVSIEPADTVAIVRDESVRVWVDIQVLCDDLDGQLHAVPPPGWSLAVVPWPASDLKRGERRRFSIEVERTDGAQAGPLRISFVGSKGTSDRTMHVIDYPHIEPQTWYSPAEIQLVPLDVEVSVDTVGYIDGAGDDIPKALQRLGIAVERIDPATARPSDLARCDAIVTGIRAYNTVPALASFNARLLEYVAGGGTLLVQYNTSGGDLVMSAKSIGPYPFSISRGRVTLEDAPATILAPEHPLVTTPNALGPADFDGWVQERGLYFADDTDARYTRVLAWNDPGEEPLSGALIACDHGEGRFIYTGISLFRQLPAGVPGAYRLLANLLARRSSGK